MLEKGTIIVNENEYINEGVLETLGLRKPKSRWQRFKDAIGRNKGKVAAVGALGALAGITGARRYMYNKYSKEWDKKAYSDGQILLKDANGKWFKAKKPEWTLNPFVNYRIPEDEKGNTFPGAVTK